MSTIDALFIIIDCFWKEVGWMTHIITLIFGGHACDVDCDFRFFVIHNFSFFLMCKFGMQSHTPCNANKDTRRMQPKGNPFAFLWFQILGLWELAY